MLDKHPVQWRFTFVLLACLGVCAWASAGPTEIPRILVAGDSWPAFMQIFRSFDLVLPEYAGLGGFGMRGHRTTEFGVRANEFNSAAWLDVVTEELLDYPTIDIVHLSLGGNDFLGSGWYPGMPPEDVQAFIDSVTADIEAVIDHILAVRPNIRVGLCGYTFVNVQIGGATIPEVNAVWTQCEQAKVALAQSNPRVFFVHNLGLMQYHFGIPEADPPIPPYPEPGHVPLPGGFAQGYVPMPGGDPNYNAPLESLIDDSLHLTMGGYDVLARRCIEEFYQQWLSWPVVLEILLLTKDDKAPEHTFRVTFSEPVTGVDPTDFAVAAVGKAPTVVAVNGSGAEYTVTVDLDGEPGTAHLEVLDDDSVVDADTNPLGGPGAGNGGFDHNGAVAYADPDIASDDFDACLESADRVLMCVAWMMPGESFHPDYCDANGGSISIEPLDVVGNGMLDSCEFALIHACIHDEYLDLSATGGATHAIARDAWELNLAQMGSDLGGEYGRTAAIIPGVDTLLAGFMTLGDPTSTMIPVLLVAAVSLVMELPPGVSVPQLADYVPLGDWFGADGDADGDGYTNREEYDFFMPLGGKDLYVMGALDPAATPEAQCTNSEGGTYDEGDAFCLIVPDPAVDLGGGFQWFKDGEPLCNGGCVYGTQWRELHISRLRPSDAGMYECIYNGDAEIFGPVYLIIEPTPVPAAGAAALAALTLATALAAGLALRSRRAAPARH